MIKTHPQSKIYFAPTRETADIDGVILQLEGSTTCDYCLVEVVDKQDYITDTEHDITERALGSLRVEHDRLCNSILKAFGDFDSAETAEIEERGHLADALNQASEWFA